MTECHVGRVVRVMGPVLDVRFREGELPALLNAIEIRKKGGTLVAEAAQQEAVQAKDYTVTGIDA